MTNKRKHFGIGLLELMLALAIIAMMMVAASKYYKGAQTARRVQVAIESVQALYIANERWIQDGHSVPSNKLGDYIDGGYLPQDFESNANPWGGYITIQRSSGSNLFLTVNFGNVPPADCKNIYPKLHYKSIVYHMFCPEGKPGDMAIDMSKTIDMPKSE